LVYASGLVSEALALKTIETEVLVIGGGLTGAGVLRDLALRGVRCLLVERRDMDAGASGANHGLLHSGARYVVRDPESARECAAENRVLKRVASGFIEDCGGLFVGLEGDDDSYLAPFLEAAGRAGVEARVEDPQRALAQEPLLSPRVRTVVRVPDAHINPFLTTLANLEAAEALGARVLLQTEVAAMERSGGRIAAVECVDHRSGGRLRVVARQVVSAAGPWVDQVGAMAGVMIPIAYSMGSLLITNSRLVDHVINRLRPPSDGDIIVPGETVTITGTNSIRLRRLQHLATSSAEVDQLVRQASQMVPAMADTRYIRVYAGVRPLVRAGEQQSDRHISRTFVVFDHERDGLSNLATITGGKLTTFRLMAERVSDLVCRRLGNRAPCLTAEVPLPGCGEGQRLDPADRLRRLRAPPPAGDVLCECELVGRQQLEQIVERLKRAGHPVSLTALRLRARLGMGSCQGGFCGFRTVGHLYQRGELSGRQGNEMLKSFLERRWAGIKPVLWGEQLRQEQLLEAIYCGTLNIDGDL
jgi:glycerol-3-phosphate dehydrogenase